MKQFKTYMKVVNAYKLPILIYLIIFVVIEALTYESGALDTSDTFDTQSISVWYIMEDEEHELTTALLDYLDQHTDLTDATGSDTEEIGDAIYFRQTEYVLTIPAGFAENFPGNNRQSLIIRSIDSSYSQVYVQNLIDTFFTAWDTYTESLPDADTTAILALMNADFSLDTQTHIYESDQQTDSTTALNQTFNLAVYSVLGCLVMGICLVMGAFYKKSTHNRILCSPVRQRRWNTSLFLSNFILGLIVYLALVILEFILVGTDLFSPRGLLLCLNLLVFTLTATALSMLIVYLFPKREVQIILANTLALGMCFLGGSFVPQSLLGDIVNNVAAFTPVHWYIRVTDTLCQSIVLTDSIMREIASGFAVQLLFAAAFLAAAMMVGRRKHITSAYGKA